MGGRGLVLSRFVAHCKCNCLIGFIATSVIATLLAGCMPTAKPSFDSAEPAARNAAIVGAAKTGDKASIPQLVRMLASDDPTTRVLAIRTLERVTGQTLGFDASGSDEDRAAGIKAWERWLAGEMSQAVQSPRISAGGQR